MPFTFKSMEISGLMLIEPRVFADDRGYFLESFKDTDFEAAGVRGPLVQDNQSHSVRGVLRGLHFQAPPMAQGKLVQCLSGRIFDVAVDIRRDSATFCKWVGLELAGDHPQLFWIPPGFAHGFLVLSETADVQYKATARYAPDSEGAIRFDDPALGIDWPDVGPLLLADKDREAATLQQLEQHFTQQQWEAR